MKLHLGCGPRRIPGWTHVDLKPYSNVDIIADVCDLHVLRDSSAEEVYACHVLEHVPTDKVLAVLSEWRRLLQHGGLLRISVPDFSVLAKLYRDGKTSLPAIAGPILGGQKDEHDAHLTIFDEPTLFLVSHAGALRRHQALRPDSDRSC